MSSGLYVLVEGIGGGHVLEYGVRSGVDGYAVGQHYYLGHLAPGGVIEGAEGVVPIPGDGVVAIQPAYTLVEVVSGVHICEVNRAWCRCSCNRACGGGVGAGVA